MCGMKAERGGGREEGDQQEKCRRTEEMRRGGRLAKI